MMPRHVEEVGHDPHDMGPSLSLFPDNMQFHAFSAFFL